METFLIVTNIDQSHHGSTIFISTHYSCFYSNHRYLYDAYRWFWVLDDFSEAARIFFFGIYIHYCHTCYRMDDYYARIPSHGWYLYNTSDFLRVRIWNWCKSLNQYLFNVSKCTYVCINVLFLMMNSRVVEGGLAAAAVLITLGAVLGKLNPFQILMLSLLETPVFALNLHLGYSILGCVDVGKLKTWSNNLRVKSYELAFLRINHKFPY